MQATPAQGWSLMTEGAQQFGIYGEEMGLSEERGLLCSGKRTSDHMQHETGRLHDDRTLHRTDRS